MINITDEAKKIAYWNEIRKMVDIMTAVHAKDFNKLLNMQLQASATQLLSGFKDGTYYAVNEFSSDLRTILKTHYERIGTIFSKKVYKILDNGKRFFVLYEKKDAESEFWDEFNRYMAVQAGEKIVAINATTRQNIVSIIQRLSNEGMSTNDIAKELVSKGHIANKFRAKTIALTETHSAATKAIDTAIKSTRIPMEKEWVATQDKRVRVEHSVADGQRRMQDEAFDVGGEPLMYPGDPVGSGWNVIRCRCVLIYHNLRRAQQIEPYEPRT